ncbi:MAG: PAS domain S-box protein [Patescibacteria group bacterium]|nr:PAS domain S-box protein [Patescibacteria group bacterium]
MPNRNKRVSPLADLVSIRTLQRLQDNLAQAMGVSLVIYDVETDEEVTKRSNMSSFCDKLRSYDGFIDSCTNDSIKFGDKCVEAVKPVIYQCHSGLYSFSVPIMIGGRVVAYFKGGQVRLSNPDISHCKSMADKYGVDFDVYLELFLATPLFTEDKINATVELLRVIANTVSNLAVSGQIAKSKATDLVHLNELLEHEVLRKTDELRDSEEKYRGIFENALDIIYTIDKEGVLTDMNNVVSTLLGYEKEDVIGKHFAVFVHSDDLHIVRESFLDLKKKKRTSTQGLRFRLKTKDGRDLNFELNSKATYDQDGDLTKIDGILRNIDKALGMENQLRRVKEKYKGLFEAMRDGVYMTDNKGKVMAFNRAALNIFGYNKLDDVLGMDIADLYCVPEDRQRLLAQLSEHGFVEDYVVRVKKKNGTPIYISVSSSRIKDKDGNFMGVEGVFHDVTKRVKLEKEVAVMRNYLENLIENAGDGIIAVDKNQKIFVWNKGAERLFGYKSDEVIGRDISIIIPRQWRTHRPELIKQVKNGEVVSDVEVERVLKNGEKMKISLTLSPITDGDGKVVGLSAIAKQTNNNKEDHA